MLEFEASTTIQAPAEKIWSVLVDTEKWPEWDPSCERIEGTVELGNTVKAFTKLSPGRAFPVKVAQLDENQQMTWTGGMPLGLFKGVRTFTLSDNGNGSVDFTLREVFSGPMLFMIKGSLPDMNPAFVGFCQGLKSRAEG